MKTIIVKFDFPEESLEGYEDCIDELIIEDHLRGCNFDHVGFEILTQPEDPADKKFCCVCSIESGKKHKKWCAFTGVFNG